MPKRPRRDKQALHYGAAPKAIGDLISTRLPTLAKRALSTPETSKWQVAVLAALGPELANKVNRCTLETGRVTVVADSAAWAARMRFALADLEPTLRPLVPGFREVIVRVRPARTPARKA